MFSEAEDSANDIKMSLAYELTMEHRSTAAGIFGNYMDQFKGVRPFILSKINL